MARVKKDVIVIPWDFTEACETALLHGIQLAKEVNNHIMLARFIDKPGIFAGKKVKERLLNEEKEKLKVVGQQILEKHAINPYITVELGYSPSHFNNLIKEAKANLVITAKTYKVNDKISLNARDLAKRLNHLDIPFLVIHDAPAHNYYKEIVVPLDHDKRYKETLQWVVYLSKYYNCNINIIKPYIEDDFKKKEMSNNIYFTKRMLDKKNIIYGIKTAKRNKAFEEEVFRFAENIDSDLIVMMIRKYQRLINERSDNNGKIPIMVVNRNSQILKFGGFT